VFHAARRAALAEAEALTPAHGQALRPAPRRRLDLAQRRRARRAGRRVGGPQRGRAPAGKCIAGQQGQAKRRIEDATRPPEDDEPGSTDGTRGVDDAVS
jgi:hypothetical protein